MEEKKVNRMTLGTHLFEYQLSLIGEKLPKSPLDVDPLWYSTMSMTRAQYLQFERYAVSLMMKVLRIPKSKAKVNFEWYWAQFGIKIRN